MYKWTSGEEGNVFELVRALFKEYEGGHALVKLGGRKLSNNYGKCTMRDDVHGPVSRWQQIQHEHATGFWTNEKETYYRILDV